MHVVLTDAAKTILQYGWIPFIIYIGTEFPIVALGRHLIRPFIFCLGYKYSIPQPPIHRLFNPLA